MTKEVLRLDSPFSIGKYRPIYLWAGPGTIRMNRLKFMDYPVDEAVHRAAHTAPIAQRVVNDLYANWAHLTYDWGFPPEVEAEDWEDFRRAAEAFHAVGSPVFAYIQVSNCVFSGSFAEKDWYARDPKGRKIYYYSGRYMTDWTHPEWIQHLTDRVAGALERGADGIFLDNMWYGDRPNNLMGAWLGGAGCYCERCRALYRAESGREIPEKILPERDEVADYLRWRAGQVTKTMQTLADTARSLKPGTTISANDYVVTMHNSYLIYGIDVEALAGVQDVIMVENFALPHWSAASQPSLANNALTIRNTRELIRGQAHLSVLSYDAGIGFDAVYPPRRHQLAVAEAAALGASMTVKGTEYNDGRQMTLLTDSAYSAQQKSIGGYHRWLDAHQALYQGRGYASPVALLHPGEALWRHWMALSPVYHGAGQALTWAGIPWRVVRRGDDLKDLSAVLTFTPEDQDLALTDERITQIHVPGLPGWAWRKPSAVAKGGLSHDLVEGVSAFLLRAYHSSKFARGVMDKLGLPKLVFRTSFFNLPRQSQIDGLLNALPAGIMPRVEAQDPVLIDVWAQGDERQVHLVNYGPDPQVVRVHLGAPARGRLISPDGDDILTDEGAEVSVHLNIYAVLILEGSHAKPHAGVF
jgi:hypothetical protein